MSTAPATQPPDARTAWQVAWALGGVELTCWGIFVYAFAVFLSPMARDLGWSQTVLTSAYSLSIAVRGVAALAVGWWVDRHGARRLMIAGACLGVTTLLGWSRIDSYPLLCLVFVTLGVVMAAVLYEPAFALVVRVFGDRRNNALLVVTILGGLASTVFLPLATALITRLGWRQALVALSAVLVIGAVLPLIAVVREPGATGEAAKSHPDGRIQMSAALRSAAQSRPFIWLTVASFLAYLALVAVNVHLVSYLLERGYSTDTAATAAGALGILSVLGRITLTRIAQQLRLARVTAALVACQALAIFPLFVHHIAGLIAFVLLFGAGFGVLTIARAILLADYAPAQMYARYAGLQAFVMTVAQVLAPVGGSLLRQWAGYPLVFICCAGLSTAAATALILADRSA